MPGNPLNTSQKEDPEPATPENVVAAAEAANSKYQNAMVNIDYVAEKLLRDESLEAKRGRRNRMFRAVYGEFVCTLIFFTLIFASVAHGDQAGWSAFDKTYGTALVAGFQATAVIYTFSNISGAHFNCSISFALWLTNKLSNRKFVLYVCAQLLASTVAMALVAAMFHGDMNLIYSSCAVVPADTNKLGRVFCTEFITTFFLTYVAFTAALSEAESEKKHSMTFKGISDTKGLTVYSTSPQSKSGFAPLAIGFTIFGLAMVGGSSGAAFNQARMFGPALFSGKWQYLWLYYIAQFAGAAAAATITTYLAALGLSGPSREESNQKTAASASAVTAAGAGEPDARYSTDLSSADALGLRALKPESSTA